MRAARAKRPPTHRGWAEIAVPMPVRLQSLEATGWYRDGVVVISALTLADLPTGAGVGLQWLISISRNGRRASDGVVRRTLRSFGMAGAEEDNHEPGYVRKFWRPLDPAHRVDCECKADEEIIVEADGYTWTNPRAARADARLCRGCELERLLGRPCSIHRVGATP